jgi:hypothetical protein
MMLLKDRLGRVQCVLDALGAHVEVGNGAYGPRAEGAYAEAAGEQPLSRSTIAGAFSAPVRSMFGPVLSIDDLDLLREDY